MSGFNLEMVVVLLRGAYDFIHRLPQFKIHFNIPFPNHAFGMVALFHASFCRKQIAPQPPIDTWSIIRQFFFVRTVLIALAEKPPKSQENLAIHKRTLLVEEVHSTS
jgi:hypothetical protein